MLRQLYIKNYALFAETQVDFPGGLNILTGETGAGKSLLVGALGLITGKRADNSVIFLENEKCIVEAKFGHLNAGIKERLLGFEDFDLEDEELLIRREIRPNGKSRAFINDTPVSLQLLRQVSTLLVDLHSQHENQNLLSHDHQIELLDAYAGTTSTVASFAESLQLLEQLQKTIRSLEQQETEAKQKWDYLQFQIQELTDANLEADEEERLEQELNLLQHAEEIREALGSATDLLYHQDLSLYNQLSESLEPLRRVSKVNTQISTEVDRLLEAQETIKEAAFTFQQLLETVESDPERLSFIEDRLAIYHTLKLKYGVSTGAELVQKWESLAAQLTDFQSLGVRIAELHQERSDHLATLSQLGLSLEKKRLQSAKSLEKEITQLLGQVGFQKAKFGVAIERNTHQDGMIELDGDSIKPLPNGLNRVYFVIQTNPGMPAGPLSQIASGGEVSRVMLAIKTVLADKFAFPVLIFDEIDTGISGEIANKVGTVMQQLANRFQIISITHLPQIASKGNAHFQIRKKIQGNTTTSFVESLSQEERIQTLAEMISGDRPSVSALKNARELLGMSG
ncbi:MAG: DNA repair protein RecN [Bacteroidota bacterium]